MVLSGWILPDGSEIHCLSCSTLRGHINVIKKYLETNKNKDYDYTIDYQLDDYAVKKMGWIKVINEPYKYVFYSGKDKYDICIHYEKFGYTIIEI